MGTEELIQMYELRVKQLTEHEQFASSKPNKDSFSANQVQHEVEIGTLRVCDAGYDNLPARLKLTPLGIYEVHRLNAIIVDLKRQQEEAEQDAEEQRLTERVKEAFAP